MHKRAREIYIDGGSFRRIARHLKVHPLTVSLLVTYHALSLPDAPVPEELKEAEIDELFTFIEKKNIIYILTQVDRQTPFFWGWAVAWIRALEDIQQLVNEAPKAK
jgi:hypothetical protein